MYAASGGNPVWDCCSCRPGALSPFILCCSASPQKVSLGSCNESLFHSRRAEVIDSGRAALCFLSGRRGIQHGSPCGEGHVPQHSVTLQISSPPQLQPESPFSPPPPLETGSDKFDLAARRCPFPGKENKYCYNGNNIYLERWRQTAAGPFEGDPSVPPYSCLILIHESHGYAY